jgi:hypothetical protein
MTDNPTLEQLRELLRKGDDLAGHHVLWVKKDRTVVLTQLPRGPRSQIPPYEPPDVQMRYGTFPVAYECVGDQAADEDWWMPLLFTSMVENWAKAIGAPGVLHVPLHTVADDPPSGGEEPAWKKKARGYRLRQQEAEKRRKEAQKGSRVFPHGRACAHFALIFSTFLHAAAFASTSRPVRSRNARTAARW